MKMPSRKFQLLAVAAALTGGLAAPAQASLDLSGASYVTYGDANSYALQVDGVIAGSTGPGSLYYVNSTPGAIQDQIVILTGASGTNVNTNLAGMDNAMQAVTGTTNNFFSGVWNSTLAAFAGFTGAAPIFFFNNNQVNSGASTNQNLAVWAQVSLTGAGQTTKYFDFTNRDSPYALFTEGGGGVFMGNVGAYTSTGAGPIAGTNAATDYVLSGGAICLNGSIPVSCSSPHTAGPINNNLGANQAAYAIVAPELDAFLASWISGGFAGYTDIHVDLRYGCDPATTNPDGSLATQGTGSCIGRDANNGYEQLFVGTAASVLQVPEPGILSLVALGLLGLAVTSRRRKI